MPDQPVLLVEVRDEVNFKVNFFALDYQQNLFLWKDLELSEPWWIGLAAAQGNTLLFQSYVNKGNPDHKNLIACNISDASVRWEVAEFSFYDWDDAVIRGYHTVVDIQPAVVDVETGVLTKASWDSQPPRVQPESVSPVQYLEGSTHFETVKKFVSTKVEYSPVMGVEYLEWKDWILVSIYVAQPSGLANYLLVFDREGKICLTEKLAENLTGLGTDTFFILSGCLFLVKNKSELVTYLL
jgi:hypothetical protein